MIDALIVIVCSHHKKFNAYLVTCQYMMCVDSRV